MSLPLSQVLTAQLTAGMDAEPLLQSAINVLDAIDAGAEAIGSLLLIASLADEVDFEIVAGAGHAAAVLAQLSTRIRDITDNARYAASMRRPKPERVADDLVGRIRRPHSRPNTGTRSKKVPAPTHKAATRRRAKAAA